MIIIDDKYQVYGDDKALKIDTLYKAKNLKNNSDVYIKVIEKNKHLNEEFASNLIDENCMFFSIECDNIAKSIYVEYIDEKYFIISEYFEGKSLKQLIDEEHLSIDEINYIFKQIISCMKVCHSKNKYHGSIRLDNILVDSDYNVKIYDFGFTAANKGVNIRANEDYIEFLCPHQININYTDFESDLFNIGRILYYALFKRMPFEKKSTEEKMIKEIDKGVDFNKDEVTEFNKGLVDISKKLLSRTNKYKNYDEILVDLTKLMYVNIEEEREDDLEEYKSKTSSSSFLIKLVAIILCIIMLIMMIL